MFDRFVQAEAGDRRRFGGIGLGLYIVRQLARAQGGEVTAEARPGGGTVMRLRLRCASAAARQAPRSPGPGLRPIPALPRPRPASEPTSS